MAPLGLLTHPAWAQTEGPPIISRITIQSTDIFDLETKSYLKKFPYTWINLLHFQTKRHVLEQELLFQVGDKVDDFLLQETERNMRALPFIRSARISKFPKRDGTVVLVIYVSDSWTTEPQLNLQGVNRLDNIEIGFKEKNLLGYGKSLSFLYNTDSASNFEKRTYRYTDRRVMGSRWQIKAKLVNETDTDERSVSLSRPFFSADTKWAMGTNHSRIDTVLEEFNKSNVKISEFDQTKEITEFFVGAKVGGGRRYVNRTGLRFKKENQNFARNPDTAPNRTIPGSQEFQTIFADFSTSRTRFIKLSRIEKVTRVEDFNLGPEISVSPGFSPHALSGGNDTSQFEVLYQQGYLFQQTDLLLTRVRHASRETFQEATNQRYELDGRYYWRKNPRQTWVVHTRVEWGDDLDSDNNVVLGSQNGLRGFKSEGIVGSKSLLLNVEDRMYFSDDVWDLFSVGGVLFFDTGYAWASGQPVAFSQLRSDVGAGLRIGLTHSSNEVIIRLDVAYQLHRLDSNDPEVVVTFGSGQSF